MGLEFITRSLKTSGVVLMIFIPFGIYYLGFYPALAVTSGAIWGIINLYLLSMLIRNVVRPNEIDKGKVILLVLLKFPLLYGGGYFLFQIEQFGMLQLLSGFSMILAVMVLKAIGRMITESSNRSQTDQTLQKVN